MITEKQAMRDRIDARFRSGNSVPVERANITASEWAVLRAALEAAEAARVGSVSLVGEPGDFAPSRIVVTPAAPSSAKPADYPNPGAHAPLRPAVTGQEPAAQGEAAAPVGFRVGRGGQWIGALPAYDAEIVAAHRAAGATVELLYAAPQPSAPGVVTDAPNFLKLRKLFSLSTAVVGAAFRLADDSADHGDRIEVARHDFDVLVAALGALDELQNPTDDTLRYGHQVLAELIRREIGGDYES